MSQTSDISDMDISDSDEELGLSSSRAQRNSYYQSEIVQSQRPSMYTDPILSTSDPTTSWTQNDASLQQQQQYQQPLLQQQQQQYQSQQDLIYQQQQQQPQQQSMMLQNEWYYPPQPQPQQPADVEMTPQLLIDGPLAVDHGFPYLVDLTGDSDSSSTTSSNNDNNKDSDDTSSTSSSESIEELYGPFPIVTNGTLSPRDSPVVSVSSAASTPATSNGMTFVQSPRPSSHLVVSKQLEIEKLKLLIAQREQAKAKKQELERQIVQQNELSVQQQQTTKATTPSVSMLSPSSPSSSSPVSNDNINNNPKKNNNDSESVDVNNGIKDTVDLKRSIDAMDREIDENKAELAAAIEEKKQQEQNVNDENDDINMDKEEHEGEDEDEDVEMDEDVDTTVISDIEQQMEALRQAIAKHDSKLKDLEKSKGDYNLKAMGLQIRISATKNKKFKESIAAQSAASSTSTPRSKYDHTSGKGKRPKEYDQRDKPMELPNKRHPTNGFVYQPPLPPVPQPKLDLHIFRKDESLPIRPLPPPPSLPSFQPLTRRRLPDAKPIHILKPRAFPPPPPSQYASPSPPPLPLILSQTSPAPPPPSSLSNPPQPPPPPPPANRTYIPSLTDENEVYPIADAMKLGTYLSELEGLIKIRFLSDTNAVRSTNPIARIPPRPSRLITVDGFTLALDSVLLRETPQNTDIVSPLSIDFASALPTHKQEAMEDNLAFDSLLYNIIQRNDRSFRTLPSSIQTALAGIVASLPSDVRDIQSNKRYGNPSFEKARQLVREATQAHPEVELLWGLFAELSLYYHGPSSQEIMNDLSSIDGNIPFAAADVIWQKIRAAMTNTSDSQQPKLIIENLLNNLAKSRGATQKSAEAKSISGISTEIIMRTLRFFGLDYVLYLLTGKKETFIKDDGVELFSLETNNLDDHDIYVVWMTVLYNLLFQRMPDSICRHWYASILTNGRPSTVKPLFTIDWAMTAAQAPLSQQEQLSSLNILLSMLHYFSKKARGNGAKRPLLMGVWQTLLNLLPHCECYKRAGTLTLLRGGLEVEALQPEIYDMAAYLETQMGDRAGATSRLQARAFQLSLNHRFLLAYRSAHNMGLSGTSSLKDMREAAKLVCAPMEIAFDIPKTVSNEEDSVYIDSVRRFYLSALGLDPTPPRPTKKAYNTGVIRHSAFAWINLMFLTQINLWIYSQHMHAMFIQQLENTRDGAMESVKSDEAKLLIFKYASEVLRSTQ
ncbi:hypothetical protein BDA99DRAFT_512680 [Phascolomyces articulosus]|uniref:Uncharacterized protein n=1 Tax=Phascolomyces articulosus TaxID=60185 RepID=A0AAD5K811_9FUNG|nr:hypothetical protein BDA99DRAFT_512680 [Phascolomyces articulosus]